MISMYFTVVLLGRSVSCPAGHRFAIRYGAVPRSSTWQPDSLRASSGEFQDGLGRVVAAEAGDRPAAPGAGAAQQDSVPARGDPPALRGGAERGVIGGPRPAQ